MDDADRDRFCGGASTRVCASPSPRTAASRAGLTLVETLAAIGLVLILFTLLAMTTRLVQASARRSRTEAQIKMLASTIEAYSQAWPLWRDCSIPPQPVADQAWPHWAAAAVFPNPHFPPPPCAPVPLPPPYDYTSPSCGIANVAGVPVATRDLSDDDDPANQYLGRKDVHDAAACLAYALLTPAVGKSLIPESEGGFQQEAASELPHLPASGATPVRLPLDAWGRPLRYLWVVRDADSTNASGWRAITSADPAAFANPTAGPPDPFFARANGFVLESAGPDGRFGNIWKRSATQQELTDAVDNLAVRP